MTVVERSFLGVREDLVGFLEGREVGGGLGDSVGVLVCEPV